MNPDYPRAAERAGHRCEYCHAPEAVFSFPFEVEHIFPTALGGSGELSNLALACRSCNLLKSARTQVLDPGSGETVSLFHPRDHIWNEHFEVEPATCRIEPLTAVGRGTVLQLQMNGETQVAARRQRMRLGLFP